MKMNVKRPADRYKLKNQLKKKMQSVVSLLTHLPDT